MAKSRQLGDTKNRLDGNTPWANRMIIKDFNLKGRKEMGKAYALKRVRTIPPVSQLSKPQMHRIYKQMASRLSSDELVEMWELVYDPEFCHDYQLKYKDADLHKVSAQDLHNELLRMRKALRLLSDAYNFQMTIALEYDLDEKRASVTCQ